MRTISEIVEACQEQGEASEQELRLALLAIFYHWQLMCSPRQREPESLKRYETFFKAMRLTPEQSLGPQGVEGNPREDWKGRSVIDPKLFTVERLLSTMLGTSFGGRDAWRSHAEIIVGYIPPYPDSDTKPRTVVRFRNSYLRYSCGPRQGHFWDVYGEDYQSAELALFALLEAPVPPGILPREMFEEPAEGSG